jgi:peptidyl-prolyl cis-trans isomerase B (cyclophilin B)
MKSIMGSRQQCAITQQQQRAHLRGAAAASTRQVPQPRLRFCSASANDGAADKPSSSSISKVTTESTAATRRNALLLGATAAVVLPALPAAADETAASTAAAVTITAPDEPDVTVTARIWLELGVADSALKAPGERALGDRTIIPSPSAALGRVEIGLYGNACPATAAAALALARSGALNGTVVSRISPGEYVQLGRQGSRRLGELDGAAAAALIQAPNTDLSSPAGFKLRHSRPGTVSLSISGDNDEDPEARGRPGYRPTEFLITTGPGPVPRLDGLNLVFGRVTEGMSTVRLFFCGTAERGGF